MTLPTTPDGNPSQVPSLSARAGNGPYAVLRVDRIQHDTIVEIAKGIAGEFDPAIEDALYDLACVTGFEIDERHYEYEGSTDKEGMHDPRGILQQKAVDRVCEEALLDHPETCIGFEDLNRLIRELTEARDAIAVKYNLKDELR